MIRSHLSGITELDAPQEWDLGDLYQGFDDPQLCQDLEQLHETADGFRQRYRGKVVGLSSGEVATALKQLEAIAESSGYLYAYPSLVFSADTRNGEAKQDFIR